MTLQELNGNVTDISKDICLHFPLVMKGIINMKV